MTATIVPGICGCGEEYVGTPHACEYQPTARQIRLCECGEYTYSPECGNPCRVPDDEIPPMPADAPRWPVKACGHLPGDECGCTEWARPDYTDLELPPIQVGVATYGRRSR